MHIHHAIPKGLGDLQSEAVTNPLNPVQTERKMLVRDFFVKQLSEGKKKTPQNNKKPNMGFNAVVSAPLDQ